jgi:hypothetical protein
MKIYLAGRYTGSRRYDIRSMHDRASNMPKYPWLLESFHYLKPDMVKIIRENKETIFLDSGAFSAFTKGSEIDINKYAAFVRANQDIIHQAASLDIIGRDSEAASYHNLKTLEGLVGPVLPTHHARDRDRWLVRFLDEGYDYICLGGMVSENSEYLHNWLDHVFGNYLTNPDGTARVKVHGFGLTSLPLILRYPWASVDSTSWIMTSRYGAIYLDLPRGDFKIDFSHRSSKRRDLNSWHFQCLTKMQQKPVLERLEQLEAERIKNPKLEAELEHYMGCKQGFNPEALGRSFGWRDYANIEYFRRAMNRGVDHFVPVQSMLF